MIGSFLTRGLVMVLGYAYPAYECYKTVEKTKPEIEQLLFWCQYWILVACLTIFERIGDAFVSWLPMYSEAKLAFFVYLWYPKTRGTTYVYDAFFRPYVAKHENDIDHSLLGLKTRAEDMAVTSWQRFASYGQSRISEILQYIASQSTQWPQPPQQQQQQQQQQRGHEARQLPKAPKRKPSSKPQQASEESQPTMSSSSSSENEDGQGTEKEGPLNPKASSSTPSLDTQNLQKLISAPVVTPVQSTSPAEAETIHIEGNSNLNAPPPQEKVMEDTVWVSRGRLRKTRSVG